jgi:ABC-type multidrug transport system ATPase subunit
MPLHFSRMDTTSAVRCEGLHKQYGPHKALRGLDLDVPAGSLFGFLGPNGAGKSTTLRILSGLVRANAGGASIFGNPVNRHVDATARAAFLIENAVFPPHLTAAQVLRRSAAYAGVATDLDVLDRVGMEHARNRRTRGYSHGMKQRLGLACTLQGKPDLLVLDEPQNGLDPDGLRTIRRILREENERGATVLVSVHRLAEVEGLCTHAAVVVQGKVVRQGSIDELLGGDRPQYRLRCDDSARAAELLGATLVDGSVQLDANETQAAEAAAKCQAAGLKLYELSPVRRSLDEMYRTEVAS